MGHFDYSQQINAESLVRLVLDTPNRQHFQNKVLAWAAAHGVTPQSVMADDGAVEEVREALSAPPPSPSALGVDPELQPVSGDGDEPVAPS